MMVGERKPGVGGEPLAGQDLRPKNSVYPKGDILALIKIWKMESITKYLGQKYKFGYLLSDEFDFNLNL